MTSNKFKFSSCKHNRSSSTNNSINMFKFAAIIFAVIACAAAKPGLLLGQQLAYTAPVVAAPAPYVTATSSQVFARNYNGIATAPVIAGVPAPVVAKYTAAPVAAPLAYNSPFVAPLAAPLTYAAHPVAAPVLL